MSKKQFWKVASVSSIFLLYLPQISIAQDLSADQASEKGYEIAARYDQADQGFESSVTDLKMVLRNGAGGHSERQMRLSTLESGEQKEGDASIIEFMSPPDVDGTALLSHAKILDPDDQWLYLPAIKRVKRISSVNKSGPFVGSEFAYEDITADELEKYAYRYLREEACGDLNCYVVERIPKYEYSGYSRQITWIDSEFFQLRKVEFYDKGGELAKTLTKSEFRKYDDGYWRAHLWEMKNHKTGKETDLVFGDYRFGIAVSETDFEPRALRSLR